MNIRSAVIGTSTLVVLLTAGAAQSLSGSNTVTSDDIVDFSIIANDIKTGAIGGRPIADNSVTGTDVNEKSLNMAGNCGPGLIGGSAIILAKSADLAVDDFSTTGVAFPHNCSGGAVEAQCEDFGGGCSPALGYTFVRFQGNQERTAVVTIDDHNPTTAVTATVDDIGPGVFRVETMEPDGDHVEADFEIAVF